MGNENGKQISKIDLHTQAKNHYLLIQELTFNPQLFHPNIVKLAIARYEKYWLPFVINHAEHKVVAPLDIEVVWIAHMLNPLAYGKDCQKLNGRLIPHTILPREDRLRTGYSESLWNAMFQRENIPFELDTESNNDVFFQSKLSSNLMEAVEDYRLFCRQVSLPHYYDHKFIESAIYSYKAESLSGDFSKTAFPYNKAFIWKTHMLNPISYVAGVESVNKSIVDKVESFNHRAKKKNDYGDNGMQTIAGAMFRGVVTPLQTLFNTDEFLSLSYTVKLVGYRLENLKDEHQYQIQVYCISSQTKQQQKLIEIYTKGKGLTLLKSFPLDSDEHMFEYNSETFDGFLFVLNEKLNNETLTYYAEVPIPNLNSNKVGKDFRFETILANNKNGQSKAGWFMLKYLKAVKSCNIVLQFSDMTSHTHSNYCQVIQHPSLMAPYGMKHDDTPCSYVDMKVKNQLQATVVNCRFVKTHLNDFLSVELFDLKNQVIACSYTIGQESLPTLPQVMHPEKCCINRGEFETVFVTRSANFDWGLLKVFKTSDEYNKNPQKIIFLNLKSMNKQWVEIYNVQLKTNQISYEVNNGKMMVNISTNTLSITGNERQFSELISLGATIISLFNVDKMTY